jgi:two-component sensor histidine kinase
MALLHETLYRTGDFGRVEFAAYLRALATQLVRGQRTRPDVRVTLDLLPTLMSIDQAVPCGLIVNELLTNSLNHAFADGRAGEIKIALHQADGRVRLAVSDDGVGLPEDLEQRRGESLGLQIVSDLVRQLGGVLTIGPAPAPVFAVVFPLSPPPEPPAPPLGA